MSAVDDEGRQRPPLDRGTLHDVPEAEQGVEAALTRLFERHYSRIVRAAAMRLGLVLGRCRADLEGAVL